MTQNSERSEQNLYRLTDDQFIYMLERKIEFANHELQLLINLRNQLTHYADMGYLIKLYLDAETNELLLDAKPKGKIGFTHLGKDEE